MVEICVFWDCGKCRALTKAECVWCKFFKTKRQMIKETQQTQDRIERLPSKENEHIKEKYSFRYAYR